jgi:hypothetical protein
LERSLGAKESHRHEGTEGTIEKNRTKFWTTIGPSKLKGKKTETGTDTRKEQYT